MVTFLGLGRDVAHRDGHVLVKQLRTATGGPRVHE